MPDSDCEEGKWERQSTVVSHIVGMFKIVTAVLAVICHIF